jgi:16S rRNA A1518/A1519 N6-dimethyltransferase RsmA/KsgA/DIM1 with predicted DNA glycosylase/AP lyase activity
MSAAIVFLCLFVITLIAGFYFAWSAFFAVPYYPSNKKAIANILKFLPKDKSKKVVELGAGDGRVAFAIAKAGYHVTAIEYNAFLTILMRVIMFLKRIKNVEIKNKNFFDENLDQYDVYVGYLFPKPMEKLDPMIFKQENRGKIVISNTFKIKNHEPKESSEKIYLYEV